MFNEIKNIKSIAVVGLAKNVGKTTTLNWLIDNLYNERKLAVTSIGLDGERFDQLTNTEKPEIMLYEGMLFTTTEMHYRRQQLCSEILGISDMTACGRLITAKVHEKGKAIIAGPATTAGLAQLLAEYTQRNIDLTLVDGALSRFSLASPAITEGLVLATGAAVSANTDELVQKTKYICQLIELPKIDSNEKNSITISSGIIGDIPEMNIDLDTIIVQGAVGNKFIEKLKMQKHSINLVVDDFTKIFITHDCYVQMLRSNIKLFVRHKSNLLAVTVNPLSPIGYKLNSEELCNMLSDAIHKKVIDVKNG